MSAVAKTTNPPNTDTSNAAVDETLADKIARYRSSEFTASVTRHFHQVKRKSLAERDAAIAKDQHRSAYALHVDP